MATRVTGKTPRQTEPAAATPRPRTRRTQQERSATARAKLLTAAISLICERGFAATTMADIATLAGMTRGAIQHHFTGRDELVLAILHELERQIVASFDATVSKPRQGLSERVSRLIDALGTVAQSQAYLAVVDIWMSTRADQSLREGVRRSMARSSESYRLLWQRNLEGLVPAPIISECRRIVVNVMRGVVISRIFIADTPFVNLTIATCKKMVEQYLLAETSKEAHRAQTSRAGKVRTPQTQRRRPSAAL